MSTVWPQEVIPDGDSVYYRVHYQLCLEGGIRPNIFREQGGTMSVDWDKYSTPTETRDRARHPAENGVVSLNVGSVRTIRALVVEHFPLPHNRSHSGVTGMSVLPKEGLAEARVHLARIARAEIPVPAP